MDPGHSARVIARRFVLLRADILDEPGNSRDEEAAHETQKTEERECLTPGAEV